MNSGNDSDDTLVRSMSEVTKYSKREKVKMLFSVLFLVVVAVFVCIAAINSPWMISDGGSYAIYFEHEYSDFRLKETPIYGNPQLEGGVMPLKLENLSVERYYLLMQFENRCDKGVWIEFNSTETKILWFNHHNRGFDVMVWQEHDDWCINQGWHWIISFDVIKYEGRS